MGRLALMMVMGLALTLGTVAYQIVKSSSNAVVQVAGFHKYTAARNIAHSGVNLALRAFDRYPPDTSLGGALSRNQTKRFVYSIQSGVCSVTVWLAVPNVQDSLFIRSCASLMDTTYTILLKVRRTPVPFPTVRAAVSINVQNAEWEINGNAAWIDGHNHDSLGNLLPPSPSDLPGVAVAYAADTTEVKTDEDLVSGSPADVILDTAMANLANFAQIYINAANYTYTGPSNVSSNLTWGSPTTPVVVFANAKAGELRFSGNVEGWGILVCEGDLTLSGSFKFHGLVIAYNDVTIAENAALSTGTPTIIGAFLMAGAPGSSFTLKGNDEILYSSSAIKQAMLIGALQTYRVCDWYE